MDDSARLLAVAVLLADPEEISDIPETGLYVLRDRLQHRDDLLGRPTA